MTLRMLWPNFLNRRTFRVMHLAKISVALVSLLILVFYGEQSLIQSKCDEAECIGNSVNGGKKEHYKMDTDGLQTGTKLSFRETWLEVHDHATARSDNKWSHKSEEIARNKSVDLANWLEKMRTMITSAVEPTPVKSEANVFFSKCSGDVVIGLQADSASDLDGVGSVEFANNSVCRNIMSISKVAGSFKNGKLEGEGVVEYLDGSYMKASFKEGVLHGLVRKFWCKFGSCNYFDLKAWREPQYLREISWHANGYRVGITWEFKFGGGAVVGHVNSNGDLTGSDIVYIYPDFWTVIVGLFDKGVLVSGQESRLDGFELKNDIAMLLVQPPLSSVTFTFEQSNMTHMVSTETSMHLRDPYEEQFVFVANSTVEEAGLGVFLKTGVLKETVVAFYNGVRMPSFIEAKRSNKHSTMYILDLDWAERNYVMDIPRERRRPDQYNATFAHLVNHASNPNSYFGMFDHPRFGKVGTIVTAKDLQAGQELFCDYGYLDKYMEADRMVETVMGVGQFLFNKKDKREFALEVKKAINSLKSDVGAYGPYLQLFKGVYSIFKG